jgi:hypothetical protein
MRSVNLAQAKAGLSAPPRCGGSRGGGGDHPQGATRGVARLIRETGNEEESEDWLARLRLFHAHQQGPAGSAVELLRELRDQDP